MPIVKRVLGDGRTVDTKKGFKIKNIWANHKEMIRLAAIGLSNKKIAAELKVTEQNVSDVLNNPLAQAEMAHFQEARDEQAFRFSRKIQAQTEKAQALYDEILEGEVVIGKDVDGSPITQAPSTALRQRTAQDILDRNPFTQKHTTQHKRNQTITPDDLAEIIDHAQSYGVEMAEHKVINE